MLEVGQNHLLTDLYPSGRTHDLIAKPLELALFYRANAYKSFQRFALSHHLTNRKLSAIFRGMYMHAGHDFSWSRPSKLIAIIGTYHIVRSTGGIQVLGHGNTN